MDRSEDQDIAGQALFWSIPSIPSILLFRSKEISGTGPIVMSSQTTRFDMPPDNVARLLRAVNCLYRGLGLQESELDFESRATLSQLPG